MNLNKKIIVRILISIFFGSGLFYLFFNENGILKYLKLKSEINKLNEDISNADMRIKNLEVEIDSLLSNKVKIEQVARERYNMMLPTENALRIEEK